MTGRDFIACAERFAQSSTEAELRTAVSRAYYGAFHAIRRLWCCNLVKAAVVSADEKPIAQEDRAGGQWSVDVDLSEFLAAGGIRRATRRRWPRPAGNGP